jgi:hypothetical protein
MPEMPYQVEGARKREAAKRSFKEDQKRFSDEMAAVLGLPEGRRLLFRLFKYGLVFDGLTIGPDRGVVEHQAGRQGLGMIFYRAGWTGSPEGMALLHQEHATDLRLSREEDDNGR